MTSEAFFFAAKTYILNIDWATFWAISSRTKTTGHPEA
jgi:hypothetical protein